jgi:hypothetical protein
MLTHTLCEPDASATVARLAARVLEVMTPGSRGRFVPCLPTALRADDWCDGMKMPRGTIYEVGWMFC